MSYNIDTWKLKKLESFRFTLADLYDDKSDLDSPEIDPDNPDQLLISGIAECGEIRGKRKGKTLHVSAIELYGDGSGNAYHDILLPLLAKSKGALEAVMVWEGGDSITRVKAVDGKVTEEQIEL